MHTAQELNDAAYHLSKEFCRDNSSHLATKFPEAASAEIKAAVARARSLVKAACAWAEERRSLNGDDEGITLEEQCPGFSPETYRDAESWGAYLTK